MRLVEALLRPEACCTFALLSRGCWVDTSFAAEVGVASAEVAVIAGAAEVAGADTGAAVVEGGASPGAMADPSWTMRLRSALRARAAAMRASAASGPFQRYRL